VVEAEDMREAAMNTVGGRMVISVLLTRRGASWGAILQGTDVMLQLAASISFLSASKERGRKLSRSAPSLSAKLCSGFDLFC
jgi:hypothetical protein